MEMREILVAGLAIVFGGLWLLRRRSRMRSDKFE
jgi:LPXTG-motif cell wall-anchored protein